MERVYHARKGPVWLDVSDTEVSPDQLPGGWSRAEWVPISDYPWDKSGYMPEARAACARESGGLTVFMMACENTIAANERNNGGAVCRDSCLECFVRPFEDNAAYMNAEINPAGVSHIATGTSRYDRTILKDYPGTLRISVSVHKNAWWGVMLHLPAELFEAHFGRDVSCVREMKGNFYCCDETLHPHFGTWAHVEAPEPDFHRPECFARIVFEE